MECAMWSRISAALPRCLKVGCPAVSMEEGKAVIDRTQCVGCTVCAQVCPFGAIVKEEV